MTPCRRFAGARDSSRGTSLVEVLPLFFVWLLHGRRCWCSWSRATLVVSKGFASSSFARRAFVRSGPCIPGTSERIAFVFVCLREGGVRVFCGHASRAKPQECCLFSSAGPSPPTATAAATLVGGRSTLTVCFVFLLSCARGFLVKPCHIFRCSIFMCICFGAGEEVRLLLL